jgi:adenylate cyclase
MDYFGPMVNRASRISAVADGGQIFVSSDFVNEIARTLETFSDFDRSAETYVDDLMSASIRRELYQLSSQGWEIKDLGERKLKGLENPESVYLMYPHSLAGRLLIQPEMTEQGELQVPQRLGKDSQLDIDAEDFWRLMKVALRLEAFCSLLENPNAQMMHEPELSLINALKASGNDITDQALLNLFEHQVARIEVSFLSVLAYISPNAILTLYLPNFLAEHQYPQCAADSPPYQTRRQVRGPCGSNGGHSATAPGPNGRVQSA